MSWTYALFVLVAVTVYWALPARARGSALLCMSLAFYASSSLPHALLIVGLALLVYCTGEAIVAGRPGRRSYFWTVTAVCVAVLGYFKYGRLGAQTLADAAELFGRVERGPRLFVDRRLWAAVPLGISFFTFEFVHYLTDVYAGRIPRRAPGIAEKLRGAREFLLFALFFPTLLAGPIKRFQQFCQPPAERLTQDAAAEGLGRILQGLVKKVLIADTLAGMASRLAVPDQVTPLGLWLGMYAYAGQIYADFSGYSDLAIGTALLLGYRVPENFDWPYLATSLSEFWRRWHMSLSSWIRDYLFIPLGGSRVGRVRAAVNLLFVMAVCGLWHGPAWHFVAWGLWHGAGLGLGQLWRRRFPAPRQVGRLRRLGYGLLTFHFVCFGWVLFAAPSLRAAGIALGRMLRLLP